MTDGLTFLAGIPNKEQAKRWVAAIEGEYPEYHRTKDTAANQIVAALTMTLGGLPLFLCLDGDKLIRLVAYRIENEPQRVELFSFAVLPAYQRRRIGTALLERVKSVAGGNLPIFASAINAPAIGPLRRAGFWKVKDRPMRNTTYKWSDLPQHQNDKTPFAEEDDE